MKKDLVIREILRQNTHWNNQDDFFADISDISYKRKIFHEMDSYMGKREILSIVGLRRTGKTVLLKQIIKKQIANGMNPRQIIFLSFDEALLNTNAKLVDYVENALEIAGDGSGKILFAVDEIQYARNWQHILKRFYDTDPKIKFIVSGSSSLFLKKKTTESLAGRIYEFVMNTLSFNEFLDLSKIDGHTSEGYEKYSLDVGERPSDENQTRLFVAEYGGKMRELFEEYLKYGQFPEIVGETDPRKKKKYLEESIYRKTIEYDIPKIFGVEKVDELKFLFQTLINETGSIVKIQNMSAEVGIDRITLKKYLGYFEDSFLSHTLYNFSKSFRKSKKNLRKIYLGSTNFASPFSDLENSEAASQKLGLLAENYFFLLLKERYRYASFFRQREKEFDFVASNDLADKKSYERFEVKYKNEIKTDELRFIEAAARKDGGRFFVISKDAFSMGERCSVIPIWLLR